METRNGSLPQDGVETSVMITSEMDPPAKPSPLRMHGLRNLAIASIICGCSCLGVLALIYAVKANEKQKAGSQELALRWAQKSRCLSVLSISVWLGLLILVPMSMVLLSYLLSQAE
ncbi:transmembrane protein 265 [Sceloporus undulatus]|uniref:transmembrane protein 265 n=1 Tax=Sceloporus undulatus TaxID=8520 RepID=UPI001C4BCFE4|nr:transmembrane protein 265 [Sceloporus undulatus]